MIKVGLKTIIARTGAALGVATLASIIATCSDKEATSPQTEVTSQEQVLEERVVETPVVETSPPQETPVPIESKYQIVTDPSKIPKQEGVEIIPMTNGYNVVIRDPKHPDRKALEFSLSSPYNSSGSLDTNNLRCSLDLYTDIEGTASIEFIFYRNKGCTGTPDEIIREVIYVGGENQKKVIREDYNDSTTLTFGRSREELETLYRKALIQIGVLQEVSNNKVSELNPNQNPFPDLEPQKRGVNGVLKPKYAPRKLLLL